MRVEWLAKALRDLDQELAFIASDSPTAAPEVFDRLMRSIELLQREPAAGFQDAVHLAIKPVAVGDVHRGVLRPHDIKAQIVERQVERVALPVIDLAREPGQPRQHLGDAAKANSLGSFIAGWRGDSGSVGKM